MRAEDGDGIRAEPSRLVATVRIDQGRVSVDLIECAPQGPFPTNTTFAQTYSGVVYVLKCLLDPDICVNDGLYRLVDIRLVAFGGAGPLHANALPSRNHMRPLTTIPPWGASRSLIRSIGQNCPGSSPISRYQGKLAS
jgi:Hydantoinase B/oxoprolinase